MDEMIQLPNAPIITQRCPAGFKKKSNPMHTLTKRKLTVISKSEKGHRLKTQVMW